MSNTTATIYKDSYINSVETFSKDSSKLRNISVAPGKELDCIINSEKRLTDFLKSLEYKIKTSKETNNKVRNAAHVNIGSV